MKRLVREGAFFMTGPNENLCNECGHPTCEQRGQAQRCESMMPVISMRNMIGTDERIFNTMRLYRAWGQRLRDGDQVMLVYGEERLQCTVIKTVVGEFNDIFLNHAKLNHTALGMKDEHHVPVVYDALIKSYGKNWVLRCGYLSVIYLTQTKGM